MDTLANMLITIKNGGNAHKVSVETPFSVMKSEIARVLLELGYIQGYEKKNRKTKGDILSITLKYDTANGSPRVHEVVRISKPSRRLYGNTKNIYQVKHGRGHLVLSTPKGILEGGQAIREHVGGELLFEIW